MAHDHVFSSPMDGALGTHPPFESMLETIAHHIVFYDEETTGVGLIQGEHECLICFQF